MEWIGISVDGQDAAVFGRVDRLGRDLPAQRDLRLVARAASAGSAKPAARVNVQVQLQPRGGAATTDLNVIGCTVEEALGRMERFLDESLLVDQRTVRVIHGYGTGQLRRALAEYLRNHPLVASHQPAPPEQGGGGVTVVELKD